MVEKIIILIYNSVKQLGEKVKIDLFKRFGYLAAVGDRHLAEFCLGNRYFENTERDVDMIFEAFSSDTLVT